MSGRIVVIAPDSFKGSLDAVKVARALEAGWRSQDSGARLVLRPMADGGEGTLDAFQLAFPGARRIPVRVPHPVEGTRDASWLLLPATDDAPRGVAVVELAECCGIETYGAMLMPFDADTHGFGVAISAALDFGVSRMILGIGSSASTDGGMGVLRALGTRFLDAAGAEVAAGARGLAAVAVVDTSGMRPLPSGGVNVMTDVVSPLVGQAGAAFAFGPQKGFAEAELTEVDAQLNRFAKLLHADPSAPGAGAAGGTGFGLMAWGAQIVPGALALADLIGLPPALEGASLVVTGEGLYDRQSASGKVPGVVAELARQRDVDVALVAGGIESGVDVSPFPTALSLSAMAGGTAAAMGDPVAWLQRAGAALAQRLGS